MTGIQDRDNKAPAIALCTFASSKHNEFRASIALMDSLACINNDNSQNAAILKWLGPTVAVLSATRVHDSGTGFRVSRLAGTCAIDHLARWFADRSVPVMIYYAHHAKLKKSPAASSLEEFKRLVQVALQVGIAAPSAP